MTLLSSKQRHAAHGSHICGICSQAIAVHCVYLDQRCAEDGTVWTFRCHLDCDQRYWRAHRGMELFEDEIVEWSEILDWEVSIDTEASLNCSHGVALSDCPDQIAERKRQIAARERQTAKARKARAT